MGSGVPMKTKIQGVVKAVPSGDTVVLVKPGVFKSGPPPEIKLTLSSIKAPALKPPSMAEGDESYAWPAREFLRKKLIGKNVVFVVEYTVAQLGRSMGTIFCQNDSGEMESVSKMLLREGLARVRRPNNPKEDRSFEYEELCSIEDGAEQNKVGLFKSSEMPPEMGRSLVEITDGAEFLKKVRGKQMSGVVDFVLNGSAMKILFPVPNKPGKYYYLTACLSGVQCPGFRRAEGKSAEEGAAPPPLIAMPFAWNAKYYTESVLLHRDVLVTFEGADKVNNLYADVKLPNSAANIAEDLLRMGLAKTMGWSMEFTSNASLFRSAEKSARDQRLGVWHDYVPNPNASIASTDVFTGRVVEIVSADTIVVADDKTGDFRRVSFASLRAPKLGRGGDKDQPMAWEGREYLRRRLIGRKVKVAVDYSRKPPEDSPHKDVMIFATISREKGDSSEDIGSNLVSNGYVTVMRHRSDEERARNYESYVQLEKEAANAKKGVHSEKPPAVRRVNDLTGPDNKKRSKEMLSSFDNVGRIRGILEYASTGSRFRVYLGKESCLIAIALKGVRSPAPSRTNVQDPAQQKGAPFGDEALHFVKLSYLQRDVEVEISSVDRTGAYLGTVYAINATPGGPEVDIGSSLLTNGYATLNEFFDPARDEGGEAYVRAEAEAKAANRGLWKDQNLLEEKNLAAREAEADTTGGKVLRGRVVEIEYGGRIYVHVGDSVQESLRKVESALSGLKIASEVPDSLLQSQDLLAARFSADNQWYRCKVLARNDKTKFVKVRFVDYGNEEWVSKQEIQRMPGAAASIPKLATEMKLQHIFVPDENDACAVDAGQALRELVYGHEIEARVHGRDPNGALITTITVGDKDVASELLRTGVARLIRQKNRFSKEGFAKYGKDEDIGRDTRNYLWRYGDPYMSDEDDSQADKQMRERRYGGR